MSCTAQKFGLNADHSGHVLPGSSRLFQGLSGLLCLRNRGPPKGLPMNCGPPKAFMMNRGPPKALPMNCGPPKTLPMNRGPPKALLKNHLVLQAS